MIVIKKKRLAYVRIFVKRADILNGIGIETGYHWKSKVTLNTTVITKTMPLTTKQ